MIPSTGQQVLGNNKLTLVAYMVCTLLIALGLPAQAQQKSRPPRVGILAGNTAATQAPYIAALREGLRALGFTEGHTIELEYRYADAKFERLTNLAGELVRLKVDVLVSAGPAVTRVAKEATSTIPIVMAQDGDPVATGFIASLARPGGNITGLSTLRPDISGKRLELLVEIVPRLARVAILGSSHQPGNEQALKETELAAEKLGVQLQYIDIRVFDDIEPAFRAASKARADALLILGGAVFVPRHSDIADLAIQNRLPAMYWRREFVEDGGLLSYAPSYTDLWRRAAFYIDRILKGAKPADLPVEQPTKFEFVINLKTAKQIGLTIPPNVLARADRVIR